MAEINLSALGVSLVGNVEGVELLAARICATDLILSPIGNTD